MWLSKIDTDGLAYGFILQIRARTLDYEAVSVVKLVSSHCLESY